MSNESKQATGGYNNLGAIKGFPVKGDAGRKARAESYQHFGITTSVSEVDGCTPEARYYPITRNGQVVAYKKRTLPKSFSVLGDGKGHLDFGGQNVCPKNNKRLLIVGGEEDAVAAYQMLHDKYPGRHPSVVWLPKGEGDTKCVADNLKFVSNFAEVILCLDMDEVGQESMAKIAKIIGPKARIMDLPLKDPSDMLVAGKEAEFIDAFFRAEKFTPVGIQIGGIGLEKLMTPVEAGHKVKCLPKTMQMMDGFREKEMTFILAPAGVGKTTIMKEIGFDLVSEGKKVVHIFLEEGLEKTQLSYIALNNNIPLSKLRKNPNLLTQEVWESDYSKYVDTDTTMWINHWGSIQPDELMATLQWAAAAGYEYVLLDHISMVFSGLDVANERKEIDLLLTQLAKFTVESGMHPIVVSHIKRQEKRWKPKEYPYWDMVASDAARGSGAFEQLAWNIIALEVQYLDDDMTKGNIRTRIWKNREIGAVGIADELTWSRETGRLTPYTVDMEDTL